MKFSDRPPLTERERAFPSAEYYEREPGRPGVLEQQILNFNCPVPPEKVIPAENWAKGVIDRIEKGFDVSFGYCMLDDRRGFVVNYLLWNNITPEMSRWWYGWINVRPQGVPADAGNLHYKLWYPGEHLDHGYINGKDRSGGYYALDYDADGNIVETKRYRVDLTNFGVSQERLDYLKEHNYAIDSAWETGEGGMRLSLNVTHQLATGEVEKYAFNWIGYGVKDGRVVADPEACCTPQMLHNMLYHMNSEGRYLEKLLPELHERFASLPSDEV